MSSVLVIRPPAVFRNRPFPDGPRLEAPLGPLYLASALEEQGIDCTVFDALAHPERARRGRLGTHVRFGASADRIRAEIASAKPRIVGINNPFTDHLPFAFEVAELVREVAPEADVVIGGPHATNEPDGVLGDCPAIDHVIRGEGERALPALVRALEAGTPVTDVPGVVTRVDGRIVHGAPFERIRDVDSLPYPAYHKTDMERLFRLYDRGFASKFAFGRPGVQRRVSIITSRGCPYTCSFCDAPKLAGHAFRAHSPEYVLDHIAFLHREYGVQHLHLNDDNLTVKRRRCMEIMRGLRDRFPDITWDTPNGVRADDLDEEMVGLARESGCTYMILGVESGDPDILERVVKKRLSLDAVVNAAAACQKVGLDVHAFYLIGLPGETNETMERTLRFARDLLVRYGVVPHLNVVEPHVGTEVHDIAAAEGYLTEPMESAAGRGSIAAHSNPFPHVTTDAFRADDLLDMRDRFMGDVLRRLAMRSIRLLVTHPRLGLETALYFLARWRRMPLAPGASLRATMMDRLLFPRRLAGPAVG